MKKKLIFSLTAGVLLSSLALYLVLRNVPFSDLIHYLETIQYGWILPTILLVVLAFILRALRWQLIVKVSAPISFRMAYHPLTIGFMANLILPSRLGEAARPLILKQKKGVPFTTGLATVAAERIFDLSFLLLFLAVALTNIPTETSLNISYGKYHLSRETLEMLGLIFVNLWVLLFAGIFLMAFNRTREILKKLVVKLPEMILFFTSSSIRQWVRRSISARVNRLLDHIAEGLLVFKHPRKIAACLGISLLIWILTALSYYVMALGCPGVELTYFEMSIVMVIVCFFIALPSVPGYWGIWEAGGKFALLLFGVPSQMAFGFTLVNHAVQLFPVIIMGFLSSLALSVSIRQVSHDLQSR